MRSRLDGERVVQYVGESRALAFPAYCVIDAGVDGCESWPNPLRDRATPARLVAVHCESRLCGERLGYLGNRGLLGASRESPARSGARPDLSSPDLTSSVIRRRITTGLDLTLPAVCSEVVHSPTEPLVRGGPRSGPVSRSSGDC
jgi:hypothetical protein